MVLGPIALFSGNRRKGYSISTPVAISNEGFPGDIWQYLKTFQLSQLEERRCCYYLVDRKPGCC